MSGTIALSLGFLAGLALGALLSWLALKSRAEVAGARLDEARRNAEEQKALLERMKQELSDTFGSLSLDALTRNTEEFKKYAQESLKAQADLGSKDLSGKKELIEQSIESMTRKLLEMQQKVEHIGEGSMRKMSEVSELVRVHSDTAEKLRETTEGLRQTLASAKKRGEWGERMAEDVIRLTGLVEGINYSKQKTLEDSSGRPDYTFYLPNNLKINMDVKFPLDNYLHYLEAETDTERKRFREELIRNVKTMIKDVGTKRDYIDTTQSTVDYAIIFIPNEQVYAFMNEADTTLMDEALRQKIILCSPFTLYAVLAVIRQAVENFNLEQTASAILNHLGDFYKQWNKYKERFKVMGERIDSARKEYDALSTTRSNMLERPLKKIDELRKQKAIEFEEQPDLDEQ
jgi:DNA recombination protein RmuC